MRSWALALAIAGCSSETPERVPQQDVDQKVAPADAPDKPDPPAKPWTFAVLSDLHLPNYATGTVDRTVAALVDSKVRFVVITGDHTNGSPFDGPQRKDTWWSAVAQALQPLRDAGIPVLPVAGNHDSYLPAQRAGYAAMFDRSWAKPLEIVEHGATQVTRWPFSYAVDVDGVHLSLIHIVASALDPAIAAWLEADLASARTAKHRIAAAHVPLSSVIWSPAAAFVAELGGILERGKVEMFLGGHEHVVWDEDVVLPSGAKLRQVLAGCASGYYDYAPSDASKRRARCVPVIRVGQREPMRCKMPNGGAFEIARGRKNRHLQHYKNAFVLVDVDSESLRVRAMTVDSAGRLQPFYLPD